MNIIEQPKKLDRYCTISEIRDMEYTIVAGIAKRYGYVKMARYSRKVLKRTIMYRTVLNIPDNDETGFKFTTKTGDEHFLPITDDYAAIHLEYVEGPDNFIKMAHAIKKVYDHFEIPAHKCYNFLARTNLGAAPPVNETEQMDIHNFGYGTFEDYQDNLKRCQNMFKNSDSLNRNYPELNQLTESMFYRIEGSLPKYTKWQQRSARKQLPFDETLVEHEVFGTRYVKLDGRVCYKLNVGTIDNYNYRGYRNSKLTATACLSHKRNKKTIAVYGSRDYFPRTLMMIDIDVNKSQKKGSHEGAVLAGMYIRDHILHDAIMDNSPSGKGIHLYFVLEKQDMIAEDIHDLAKDMEKRFKLLVDEKNFDVECIEVKGVPCSIEIKQYRDGLITYIQKCGSLMTLPRNPASINDAPVFPAKFFKTDEFWNCKEMKKRFHTGKGSTHFSYEENELDAYRYTASLFLSPFHDSKYGLNVTMEDWAVFLFIQYFIALHPNKGIKDSNSLARREYEDTNPRNRTKKIWDYLYEQGATDRKFNNRRFQLMRNHLTETGKIDWIEDHFFPTPNRSGVASKWRFTDKFCKWIEFTQKFTEILTDVSESFKESIKLANSKKHDFSRVFNTDASASDCNLLNLKFINNDEDMYHIPHFGYDFINNDELKMDKGVNDVFVDSLIMEEINRVSPEFIKIDTVCQYIPAKNDNECKIKEFKETPNISLSVLLLKLIDRTHSTGPQLTPKKDLSYFENLGKRRIHDRFCEIMNINK